MPDNWIETNNYLKGITNNLKKLHDPIRIAAFDLDDTIIHRPKKDSKWKLLNSGISDQIEQLVNDNYIIVIFTNQGGMSMNKNFDKIKWRKAMDDLEQILFSKVNKYYLAVYVAKIYDIYRKPNLGLWNQMKSDLREEFSTKKLRISKKSFFVGDAGGRISAGTYKLKMYPSSRKGDFSDVDRKFALNIGIEYLTPEEFYLGESSKESRYVLSGFDPEKFLEEMNESDNNYEFHPRKKEMILMIGAPGSGKSEFAQNYIVPHGYKYINMDTCKTKKKCLSLAEEALEKGKSVVIDNTSPSVLSRMPLTTLAQDYGYKHIRAIIMNTDPDMASHLNNVRHIYSEGIVPKVSPIANSIFKKNYVKPQKSEHFDKIETVDFVFNPEYLEDPVWKKIFMMWSE